MQVKLYRYPGEWELNIGVGQPGWCGNFPGDIPPPDAKRMNWWSLRIGNYQFSFWHNYEAIFNFIRPRKIEKESVL